MLATHTFLGLANRPTCSKPRRQFFGLASPSTYSKPGVVHVKEPFLSLAKAHGHARPATEPFLAAMPTRQRSPTSARNRWQEESLAVGVAQTCVLINQQARQPVYKRRGLAMLANKGVGPCKGLLVGSWPTFIICTAILELTLHV